MLEKTQKKINEEHDEVCVCCIIYIPEVRNSKYLIVVVQLAKKSVKDKLDTFAYNFPISLPVACVLLENTIVSKSTSWKIPLCSSFQSKLHLFSSTATPNYMMISLVHFNGFFLGGVGGTLLFRIPQTVPYPQGSPKNVDTGFVISSFVQVTYMKLGTK